ncbi:MAG: DUF2231 domain-containing protein [Ignavibacteriales bacterium]|nr:DUF2231 domain-containing protein [Ignavibacteriales bacterium]MCB9210491.1 DUF2231 domain-containing protein [Ignavibacteriales bacterium]
MEFLAKLHPLVIHFPIALLFFYILLEVSNIFINKDYLRNVSLFVLLLGVIGGVVAVLTGNQSLQILEQNSNITRLHIRYINNHEYFATITLWYFFVILIVKIYLLKKKNYKQIFRYLFVIFVIGGGIILYQASKLGGKLVYSFGIGTDLLK